MLGKDEWNIIGILYNHAGMYDGAIHCFNQALVSGPKDIPTLRNLGLSNYYKRDYTQALHFFDMVLTIDNRHVMTLNDVGRVYLDLKKYNEAKKYFDAALEIERDNPVSNEGLGISLYNLEKPDEAYDLFKIVLRQSSNSAESWYYIGKIKSKNKDYNGARDAFEKAVRSNPSNNEYYEACEDANTHQNARILNSLIIWGFTLVVVLALFWIYVIFNVKDDAFYSIFTILIALIGLIFGPRIGQTVYFEDLVYSYLSMRKRKQSKA